MAFFKEEDTKRALTRIKEWATKHPVEAAELQKIWKEEYMTAGHKTMARAVMGKEAGNESEGK